MKIVDNFFNKLTGEIDSKYFPNVKYYMDDNNCAKSHYTIELFNNGCLTYDQLIQRLSYRCKDSQKNISVIVNKYIIKDVINDLKQN